MLREASSRRGTGGVVPLFFSVRVVFMPISRASPTENQAVKTVPGMQ